MRQLKSDGQLLTELYLADKLGKTLSELQEVMTPEELMLWVAYYNYQLEEQKAAAKRQQKRRR